jgi:hypothetical protein
MTRRGFPHSDIPGSKLVCSSPRLFAAYRVLHRLLAPRHSPYALSSLTIGIQELTIGLRPFAIRSSRQSLFPPSLRTLRVFCDYGKNYRLQDIQLRKNIVKFREPDFYDDHCRRKLARALAPVQAANRARFRGSPRETLVENTGLEPVTSWLQTRRSPS